MDAQKNNGFYFGFDPTTEAEKTPQVQNVFSQVSSYYDLMNDGMSLGMHRLWKNIAVDLLSPCAKDCILDLAGGTGDLTCRIKRKESKTSVFLADLNMDMLNHAKSKLLDQGTLSRTAICQANAETLPFINNSFNKTIIAFGLRNVTNIPQALNEMYRTLAWGGQLFILEFSHPDSSVIREAFSYYSMTCLPAIGNAIAEDSNSYRYLAESIRMFPKADELTNLINKAGFVHTTHATLLGGIVALHRGFKC